MEKRLKKISDEHFFQPGICAEASQIPMIAESESKYSFGKLLDSARVLSVERFGTEEI